MISYFIMSRVSHPIDLTTLPLPALLWVPERKPESAVDFLVCFSVVHSHFTYFPKLHRPLISRLFQSPRIELESGHI